MIVNVKVKTQSGKQEIVKLDEDSYIVSLKSIAENNKANIELLKLLRKYFKKHVKIVKGKTSRNKIAEFVER